MAPVTSFENDLLYPARDTLLHVIKYGGKWRDRRLEKHVLPVVVVVVVFFFSVNEHNNTITKPQPKKQQFLTLSQTGNSS